ncbi:MAG: hypothetical protein QGG64_12220, partial [Candidatus Latescibacteria bacterium]|nr:hypothetical protein [Candidatus Latescibacterota bacterium]
MPEVLQAFTEGFLSVWKQSIEGGQGPHVFHFGSRCWQALEMWGENTDLSFLWAADRSHHTDLRQLLSAHFDFPIPGTLTLFALSQLLDLNPGLSEPESLFHSDDPSYISPEEWMQNEDKQKEMAEYLNVILGLQTSVWQWASSHLESEWEQGGWETRIDELCNQETAYLSFLEEERRLRETDVITLQALPLE